MAGLDHMYDTQGDIQNYIEQQIRGAFRRLDE